MLSNIKKVPVLWALLLIAGITAQAQVDPQERAGRLHAQLTGLQSKQVELQSRLDSLNEQLKPENIERSLAGQGSTRPEELRELRRRQFETEKSGVEKQLAILNDSRAKLEASIAQAEAVAYQQSALPAPTNEKVNVTTGDKVSASNDATGRPRPASRKRVRARRVNR